MAPVQAASEVVTNTNEVKAGSPDSTDPPLNPNQPNQRRNTPITASGTLEPGLVNYFTVDIFADTWSEYHDTR